MFSDARTVAHIIRIIADIVVLCLPDPNTTTHCPF